MSITNSVIVEDRAQRDGRRSIREQHTDSAGGLHYVDYLAEAAANVSAIMTARVAKLESTWADAEIESNYQRALDQLMPVLVHSTLAQFRAALRARFRDATGWELVRLGKFINSLALSDAQLTSLFGVSGVQLTALKTKLAALASRYDDVVSQVGS